MAKDLGAALVVGGFLGAFALGALLTVGWLVFSLLRAMGAL
jgi:hypothetical protein